MPRPTIERNSRKIIKRLKDEGWDVVSIEGSHHKLRHPDRPNAVIVPHPKKDLAKGTARAIARGAGWMDEKP